MVRSHMVFDEYEGWEIAGIFYQPKIAELQHVCDTEHKPVMFSFVQLFSTNHSLLNVL